MREHWNGKLILKSILDEEDARIAHGIGADAVIVSNHGGRQLDGAPSTISMMPRIADVLHGDIELHMDGGIRSGQDVLKAFACGAHPVHMGRAFLYGLGVEGEAGVARYLEIVRDELDMTMTLAGVTDVRAIDGDVLRAGGFMRKRLSSHALSNPSANAGAKPVHVQAA